MDGNLKMKQAKINQKITLLIVGLSLISITLLGGYKLHRMVWAALELPVIALILALRWRTITKKMNST